MTEIFVNYRTSDEPLAALLIDQALTASFGVDQVFRDNRSIELGTHFPPMIWAALQSCKVLVAVIGTRWLDADQDGNRRIDDPRDYVRREIAEALRRQVVRVIPILVGGAKLPTADMLPDDVAGLASQQYLDLRVRGAEYDIERLKNELVRLIRPSDRPEEPAKAAAADTPGQHFNFYDRVRADVIGIVYDRK